ncbi:MAG TPA: hypothetical protein VHM20_07960, partial [Gammaproteobacteria bacterium]|nr:hypothetical protein [Gammaproteobacteria bacterium]
MLLIDYTYPNKKNLLESAKLLYSIVPDLDENHILKYDDDPSNWMSWIIFLLELPIERSQRYLSEIYKQIFKWFFASTDSEYYYAYHYLKEFKSDSFFNLVLAFPGLSEKCLQALQIFLQHHEVPTAVYLSYFRKSFNLSENSKKFFLLHIENGLQMNEELTKLFLKKVVSTTCVSDKCLWIDFLVEKKLILILSV